MAISGVVSDDVLSMSGATTDILVIKSAITMRAIMKPVTVAINIRRG